tara:strand:- start:738 stop:1496 length:759 start_codon:yes stop_codon:yes gene_type:complete
MKIKIILLTVLFSAFHAIYADDHIEIGGMAAMQCQIAEGSDMDDVMKVLAEWDEYGDENFSEPFSAWVMTPVYMSNIDFNLDFVFLGFAETLASVGRAEDEFRKGGARIGAKWERVTNCSGMSLNLNVEGRAPKNGWVEGATGYTMIQSCSFKEGKTVDDLQANDKIWNKYLDDSGFEGGYWRWWPESGSPTETDYDYLLAVSFSSVEEYGASRDNRLKAMMNDTRPEEVHECNTPRLYESTNIRLNLPSEG